MDTVEHMIHWVHDGLITEIANDDLRYKTGSMVVIRDARFEIITNNSMHAPNR